MLVSAVSMNGVIPAIKNSKQSNSNYASTSKTHDTFEKPGVNFGIKANGAADELVRLGRDLGTGAQPPKKPAGDLDALEELLRTPPRPKDLQFERALENVDNGDGGTHKVTSWWEIFF